ncbi:uncharacterized protein LOC142989313 [Genypterus blacodes]|uniref:uncharacterized protein LOC142989313 n=1 Tax=Genypterus blacodes TaxID=154954 RepID=UPI003F772690
MVKMSGRKVICCLTLFLALTSVSAIKRLNTINDLKKIKIGRSVPKHSLLLLHWFSNTIDIDNNDVIWMTFDPNRGDYGWHYYGNFERVLPQLQANGTYFTGGNLHQRTDIPLPSYITHPHHSLVGSEESNRDRIIVRVTNNARSQGQRIDRVYITQHFMVQQNLGTGYDLANTYEISNNLLREMREFAIGNQRNPLSELRDDFGSQIGDSQLEQLSNSLGNLAKLGLLLLIVLCSVQPGQDNNRAHRGTARPHVVNIPVKKRNHIAIDIPDTVQHHSYWDQRNEMNLKVMTGLKGKARMVWTNVPHSILNQGVMVVLFKNNNDQESMFSEAIDVASGSYDTSVQLNPGLQVRLHGAKRWCCLWKAPGEEISRGDEFCNPGQVQVRGHDARLQLCVRNGKACARLHIKQSFSEWGSEFTGAWVGFYSSAQKAADDYEWWQWQWVTKFQRANDSENLYYDVYEYQSGLTMAEGVQARFILKDQRVIASTPVWQ